MNKLKPGGAHVGSASILLIFSVLSLISFACLTLINSKADYNLSTKLDERQRIYYYACHKGNAFIAAANSGYKKGLTNDIMKESIPLTDNQSLNISLGLNVSNNLDSSDNLYSVIQWQIVNHADFEYDYSLPVMQDN